MMIDPDPIATAKRVIERDNDYGLAAYILMHTAAANALPDVGRLAWLYQKNGCAKSEVIALIEEIEAWNLKNSQASK